MSPRAIVVLLVGAVHVFGAQHSWPVTAPAAETSVGERDFFSITPGTPGFTYIGVKGYQQTTGYTCGPSSVMSVMHYYGKLNDSQLTHGTEMKIAAGMQTNPNNGTSAEPMVAWLNANGFDAYSATGGTITDIKRYLKEGTPVIIDWVDWGGHWVAATGYFEGAPDPESGKDTIFFADPAAHFQNVNNSLGITGFVSDRFADMWFNLNGPGFQRGLHVIARPKKA